MRISDWSSDVCSSDLILGIEQNVRLERLLRNLVDGVALVPNDNERGCECSKPDGTLCNMEIEYHGHIVGSRIWPCAAWPLTSLATASPVTPSPCAARRDRKRIRLHSSQ